MGLEKPRPPGDHLVNTPVHEPAVGAMASSSVQFPEFARGWCGASGTRKCVLLTCDGEPDTDRCTAPGQLKVFT